MEPKRSVALRVGALEDRVAMLETSMETVRSDVKTVRQNTDDILMVLTAAKGVGGFIAKHGPRFAYLGIGIAVSAGWISAETGHSVGALFGLT